MKSYISFSILFALSVLMLVASCAPKDSIQPLYSPQDYKFETITLNVPTTITNIAPIQPTGIRRFIAQIPVLGKLIAIPLDITQALIPNIPLITDYENLNQADVSLWADPDFLSLVKSLKLTRGWLRQKSDEEVLAEGHDLGTKKTWLCQSKGLEFMKNMTVLFEYQDHDKPNSPVETFPLGYTNNSKKYFREVPKTLANGHVVKTNMFTFEVLDEELKDYISNVNNFRLKLTADGKIPCETIFLEAGLEVRVVIDVKKPK